MTVVILTAVPPGLRGHLTRWLLELSPGVFVGNVSARVRAHTWERVVEFIDEGRALMVYSVRGEQRLAFEVHGHDWTPVDYDGITLMRRQTVPTMCPLRLLRCAREARPRQVTPSGSGASPARSSAAKSDPKMA